MKATEQNKSNGKKTNEVHKKSILHGQKCNIDLVKKAMVVSVEVNIVGGRKFCGKELKCFCCWKIIQKRIFQYLNTHMKHNDESINDKECGSIKIFDESYFKKFDNI